eukprot:GHVO01060274.1.p1 GENE.GHVO01060274.1~~GHVO01060274.1.p1  ORF type:complete len:139 (-),score=14.89 GHVO01060274.1:135-551(-)
MLGLRTAHKEDLGASPAELIYRHKLKIPGEVCGDDRSDIPTPVVPRTPDHHNSRIPTFIPQALKEAKLVLVRIDAHRRPLDPLYSGPYEVLERFDKYFVVTINSREETVSIDRLKPATVDQNYTARSGRSVKPPVRFS